MSRHQPAFRKSTNWTASSSKSACGTRWSAATTNSTQASLPERASIPVDEGGVFIGKGGDRRIVQALAMLRRGKAGVGADAAIGKPAAVVAGVVELAAGCDRRLQRSRLDVVGV